MGKIRKKSQVSEIERCRLTAPGGPGDSGGFGKAIGWFWDGFFMDLRGNPREMREKSWFFHGEFLMILNGKIMGQSYN